MKTIHKYPINFKTEELSLTMPINAQVLTVQFQNDQLCLWARVDSEEEQVEKREFRRYGTGLEVNEFDLEYISTVQEGNGSLVWHIFENK